MSVSTTAQMRTEFMTTALWGVGSTPPYGHDGRSINLTEAAAAALRAAQLEMSADPRWAPPSFWAGFVLQGDWR